jgi:cytochrome c oxidase cbb3-type subunit III
LYKFRLVFAGSVAILFFAAHAVAQAPAAGRAAPGRGRAVRPPAFPEHAPADPAAIERGKALYGVQCNFCHGSDARGGEGGPNLLRSEIVLNDQNGEKIAPVVQNGRVDAGMPKFDLTTAQISDIAAYIHSFKVGGYDISRMTPPSILVGNAAAGEKYFTAHCGSCHSATGDLKGLAGKFSDPKQLQQTWLMPGGGRGGFGRGGPVNVPPVTVTVSLPTGEKVNGRLLRIDDFTVTLADPDGGQRTFTRNGETPGVELHDPVAAHRSLVPTYSDKEIHDVTAYLETLK